MTPGTAISTVPVTPSPLSYPMRRFTVDEYHRLIEVGILTEDDRVELLEGWIVLKMAHNPPHDLAIELAEEALRPRLPAGWRIRIQSAITTADSEPEPDLAVALGSPRARGNRHPGPADLALVIEVADSSVTADRDDKGRIYARAGIACYWLVNLIDRRVEVYTDPSGPVSSPAYGQRQDCAPADEVPLVIGGQEVARIPVVELLP